MTRLQQWSGLSDPQAESACIDRLSFRSFLRLGLEDRIPDETSLLRFRNRIRESKGFNRQRLKALNHELEQRGVIIRQGTMIDVGMIESSRRPTGKNNAVFTTMGLFFDRIAVVL